MIELRFLTPADEANYRRFLVSDPRMLIYATSEFRDFLKVVAGGQPNYLLACDGDRILGALPYFRQAHPEWGTVVNSLPWYGSYGGCTLSPGAGHAVWAALVEKYAEIVSAPDVLTATMILSPFDGRLREDYLHILKPVATDERIGQITLLPQGGDGLEERLLNSFKQKTRNLVRKSLAQGFSLTVTDEDWAWNALYEIHVENMQGIGGKAKPRGHFGAMRQVFPCAWRDLLIAMVDGIPAAALLLFYFNKTIEYITPVIKHEFRPQQPLSFLIWHGMLNGIRKGYRYWNWGGTWISQTSVHHFKAGWGADDLPYTYLISASQKSVHAIKGKSEELQDAFPYYYVFPYDKL